MERYFGPDDVTFLDRTERQEALAAVFSEYLNTYRRERCGAIRSLGVTAAQPELSEGVIRLPHLVVFQDNNETQDIVLWERIALEDARIWLGGDLPDQEYVEAHIEDLLAMKRRIRTGEQLTQSDQLVKERMAGRYLSILFVYQNFQLFKELWEE